MMEIKHSIASAKPGDEMLVHMPAEILLVEDEPYDHQSFCIAFTAYAVNITWCQTAEEALQLLHDQQCTVDIIVCDYGLPAMNGLELSLKLLDQQYLTPIVLLTGCGTEVVAVKALKAGVYDYVIKDIEGNYLKTLPELLSQVMSQYKSSMEKKQRDDKLSVVAKVFANTTEAILISDADNLIESVNQAFVDNTGYSAEEVVGKNPAILSSKQHKTDFYQSMWAEIAETGGWKGEVWNRNKNGEICPQWLIISTIKDFAGKVIHYIGVYININNLNRSDENLYQYAYYDELTTLPNRTLLMQSLQHEISRNIRDQSNLALMFIDLDHFKLINDSLGHQLGDEYLKVVAERIKGSIRQSDIAARLSGDEFVIIFPQIKSLDDTSAMAKKILRHFAESFMLGDKIQSISASIGIAICPENGIDAQTLIKKADIAMYLSKQSGRNRYHYFTQEMQLVVEQRKTWILELQTAIEENQFRILYQPFVNLKSGLIIGAEALLHWQHPTLGLLGPEHFIQLAEETGLIIPLGHIILESVCRQNKQWQDADIKMTEIAINLSHLHILNANFLTEMNDIINQTKVDPSNLTLEFMESLMFDEQDKIIPLLKSIKKWRIKLSLDNFGTGVSSLSQIRHFPLDLIKIPKPFVRDFTEDQHHASLAETVAKIGHSLNLKVVAQGIETEQQLMFVKQLNCEYGQGLLFSKYVEAQELSSIFANKKYF